MTDAGPNILRRHILGRHILGRRKLNGVSQSTESYQPPALPPARANLAHIVIPGTILWFVGFIVLLFFTDTLRRNDDMIFLWTALAGWVLGIIGLGIYFWQRAAARRGTRASNKMALEEDI